MGPLVRILVVAFLVVAQVAIADGSSVVLPLSPTSPLPGPLPVTQPGKQHRHALSASATPSEATDGVPPGLPVEDVEAHPGPRLLPPKHLLVQVAPLQWLWVVAVSALGLWVWRLLTTSRPSFLFVLSSMRVDRRTNLDDMV